MQELEFTPKNCWERFSSNNDINAMESLVKTYLKFLTQCKTERETIHYVLSRLKDQGIEKGFSKDFYVRTIQDKAVFIARKGKKSLNDGLQLIFAHTDSPRLDLKQHPLLEQANIGQAKTHYYGGIRKYQWFSRPLALHGVVVKDDGTVINVCLGEKDDEPVFTIADLLPHLAAKQADQKLRDAFEAEKMNIILGHSPLTSSENDKDKDKDPVKKKIIQLLHERYGIREEDLYSAELQAVPAGPAREVGLDRALVGAYGQDDRVNVFLALEAFIEGLKEENNLTQCLVFLDKEEIGSEGSTGAKSRFFEYCVQDLISEWESGVRFSDVMLSSRALSADVHGGVDPDWQELHEKLNAAPLGYGPCFCKFTGSRGKYEANDAHPEYIAWLRKLLNSKDIPWQMAELGKVDTGGGGTVAMYFAAYGMNIIDFGPCVLGMHSPFELTSKADLYATKLALAAFLQA